MQYVNTEISPELTYEEKKKKAEQIKKSRNKSAKRKNQLTF